MVQLCAHLIHLGITIGKPGDQRAAAIARASVDTRLDGRALQDAIKTAIGERRGFLSDWWVDDAGWCVELLSPVRETFRGLTLEFALAWCLVYLMTDELGIDGFAG